MKYLVTYLSAILLLLSVSVSAQDAFKKFENSDNVGTVIINKGMLDLVSGLSYDEEDKEARDFVDMAGSIDKIRVFVSEATSASTELTATAKKHIKKSRMEKLMKVRDGEANVDFYVKSGKDDDHVSEMLMLVTGMDKKGKAMDVETVVVTMSGDIDLTKIGSLVNKMNLPKDLEKVEKEK